MILGLNIQGVETKLRTNIHADALSKSFVSSKIIRVRVYPTGGSLASFN
jgi:hypothetical protein